MKFSPALFLVAFALGVTAHADVALVDVELRAQYQSVFVPNTYMNRPGESAQLGPVYTVRFHTCSRPVFQSLTFIGQQSDLKSCSKMAELGNLSAKSYTDGNTRQVSASNSTSISVTQTFRSGSQTGIALGDVVLVASLWEHRSTGNDYFIAQKILSPLTLKMHIPEVINFVDGTNQVQVGVSLTPTVPDVRPEYAQFNPPTALYDPGVVESFLGKRADQQVVADLMWLTIVYYMNPASPVFTMLPLGDENSAEFRRIKDTVRGFATKTDQNKGLLAYQQNYRKILVPVTELLKKEEAKAQAQAAELKAKADALEAQKRVQAQLEESNRIQQQIAAAQQQAANAQAQQARLAQQRRNAETAVAIIGIAGLLAGAAADGVNKTLR